MSDVAVGILAIVALLGMVLGGMPIAFALMLASVLGMVVLTGSIDLAALLASESALNGIRSYIFVVVPMFVLMGAFMSNSPAARYIYGTARLATGRMVGGLASATVFGNAIFGAVTGVSVASAAIFSRIALPEMLRQGYNVRLALGSVAGSSVLGMLIPPSLLMILYGILAEVSIGKLFIAGIVPGLLLATVFVATITLIGWMRPAWVGRRPPGRVAAAVRVPAMIRSGAIGATVTSPPASPAFSGVPASDPGLVSEEPDGVRLILRAIPIGVLIAAVLGGIWLGWFTPTEAAAVGAFGAFVIAIGYGMRRVGLVNSLRETAVTTGALMLLLIAAQMFSRMLARSGIVSVLSTTVTEAGLSRIALVVAFIGVIVLLGAVLDSSSILLIMVPVMVPVASAVGLDLIWFGIVVIIAVEMGLLTPPFGMVPFAMVAVLRDRVKVTDIFAGSVPFLIAMAVTLVLLILFPSLVIWLPFLT